MGSNVARATLTVELTDRLGGGERVQYSTDGRNWSDVADDKVGDGVVNIEGIDLSKGAPVSDAVGADKQTTVYVRLIDAAGNATAQPARQAGNAAGAVELRGVWMPLKEDGGKSSSRHCWRHDPQGRRRAWDLESLIVGGTKFESSLDCPQGDAHEQRLKEIGNREAVHA